jgi:hypothetical protein
MAIMSLGLFLLTRLGPGTSAPLIMLPLAVFGFGTGLFISPNTNALMGSAPRNRQGIASGVLATARNCGMVLGIGLAAAIFTTIQSHPVASDNANLYRGISASLLVACLISLVGTLISASRGQIGKTDQGISIPRSEDAH